MAMALCVSCKKDDDSSDSGGGNGGGGNTGGGGGSQTVEMRISKIIDVEYSFEQTGTMDYFGDSVITIFTWDNKILSNINLDHYHSNGPGTNVTNHSDNCVFYYDNNRLSYAIMEHFKEAVLSRTYRVDFTYDGDNISEWTVKDGEIDEVYHLEYSNGKLSLLIADGYGNLVFNWNGDNLSEVRKPNGDVVSFLSYDDKKNPFYGIDAWLVFSMLNDYDWRLCFSKNNWTVSKSKVGTIETFDTTVDYTYNDKNYPTQAVMNVIYSDPYGQDVRVRTRTYEYLD